MDPAPLPPSLDLAVAALLALGAAVAALLLPEGSLARLLVAGPVLLVVPGYALLEAAIVPAAPGVARLRHALVGIGVSPAVVGLSALATALVPGGFRPGPIVATVTAITLALAAVAFLRRRRAEAASRDAGPAGAEESAT